MSGIGNVIYGDLSAEASALVSTGTGLPVFVPPNKIKSLVEESGIELDDIGPGVSIGIKNRLNWFFVQQFGAKGDGVTDDTAAIQAAFTAAGAGALPGCVVYFAPGTYLVSGTITGPAGPQFWIMGCGFSGGTTINMTADEVLFQLSGTGCKITDIAMTYTGAGPAAAAEAVNFTGFNFCARNCGFNNWFNGVVQTNQIASFIEYCGFSEIVNHAIDISNAGGANEGDGAIAFCIFESNTAPTAAAYFQNGGRGQKLIGCQWLSHGSMQRCIEVQIDAGEDTADLVVSNCAMEGFSVAGIDIEVEGTYSGIVLIGNNIDSLGLGGNGIVLNNAGGALSEIGIVGNSVIGCVDGIQINDAQNVTLVGNIMGGNTNDVVRSGSTSVNYGLAGDDNAAEPAVTAVVPSTNVYGSNAALLSTPDAWTAVEVDGTTYKMPLYL